MPIPVELRQLRARLQEIGMVVVEEPDRLTVRLPYFCSVRIYSIEGRLRFESYFGMVPRTRSTMTKIFVFTSATLAAFTRGMPYALGIAMVGIMAGIYDVIRVIVTENVITRATVAYSALVHDRADGHSLASQSTRALGAANAYAAPQPPVQDAAEARVRRDR